MFLLSAARLSAPLQALRASPPHRQIKTVEQIKATVAALEEFEEAYRFASNMLGGPNDLFAKQDTRCNELRGQA